MKKYTLEKDPDLKIENLLQGAKVNSNLGDMNSISSGNYEVLPSD